jgi:hypothetical protein
VIEPLAPIDLDAATDEEIVAAYLADGESEAGARAYLSIIRGKSPAGAIVD